MPSPNTIKAKVARAQRAIDMAQQSPIMHETDHNRRVHYLSYSPQHIKQLTGFTPDQARKFLAEMMSGILLNQTKQ